MPQQRESSGVRRDATLTKRQVIDRVAAKTGYRRADVKLILQTVLDEVASELGDGNRVEFRDFGVFEVQYRAARSARNPRTLEPVEVPPTRTVRFKLGRMLRGIMDGEGVAGDTSRPPRR